MPEAKHYLTLCNDFDGWDYAECACGWMSPPCPDVETAADFYGDHRASPEVPPEAALSGSSAPDTEGEGR